MKALLLTMFLSYSAFAHKNIEEFIPQDMVSEGFEIYDNSTTVGVKESRHFFLIEPVTLIPVTYSYKFDLNMQILVSSSRHRDFVTSYIAIVEEGRVLSNSSPYKPKNFCYFKIDSKDLGFLVETIRNENEVIGVNDDGTITLKPESIFDLESVTASYDQAKYGKNYKGHKIPPHYKTNSRLASSDLPRDTQLHFNCVDFGDYDRSFIYERGLRDLSKTRSGTRRHDGIKDYIGIFLEKKERD